VNSDTRGNVREIRHLFVGHLFFTPPFTSCALRTPQKWCSLRIARGEQRQGARSPIPILRGQTD